MKTPQKTDVIKLTNYIFELNTLKKFSHSGFKLAGIRHPDTIAEHVYRTSTIGYLLAKAEKADAAKVMMICLIHDNGEARITDLHKVASRYIDSKKSEMAALIEQSNLLPPSQAKEIITCFKEYEERKTKEGIIARDADLLETAFQAKEYLDLGYKACQDWINNVEKALKTATAKAIMNQLKKSNFSDWWKGLKKLS